MTAPIPGVGPQLERAAEGTDPRGWLVFESLPGVLQRAEDSTLAADRERWPASPRLFKRIRFGFERPATDTERQLLQHLGYVLPDELTTRVKWVTPGCRNRRWPQLETQEAL